MITPRWVDVRAPAHCGRDVLAYLEAALDFPVTRAGSSRSAARTSCPTATSCGSSAAAWPAAPHDPCSRAHAALSSLWLGLVTPLYARVGRVLVDSIRHPTVVRDDTPVACSRSRPLVCGNAIALALRNEDREIAETRWTDARVVAGPERSYGGARFGNRLVDSRTAVVPVTPEVAFAAVRADRRRHRLVLRGTGSGRCEAGSTSWSARRHAPRPP